MKAIPLLWLLALVSGALIPVQAAANAALSRSIHGNIPFAAGMLFLVAGLATALVALAQGGTHPGWADLRGAPWWSYSGGLIVAFYVFTISFLLLGWFSIDDFLASNPDFIKLGKLCIAGALTLYGPTPDQSVNPKSHFR